MLGKLDNSKIEALLKSQVIGRIGCCDDGVCYIVPVNYVYDGKYIFAHSAKGMKLEMLRNNPDLCFEVDHITDIVNWESVIAWGVFEEITDLDEQQEAMQQLTNRISPFLTSKTAHPSHGITAHDSDIGNEVELVVYKINLTKKTGRFERQ
ncbi:hypothetical protein BH09BAC6_BH09BAC6_32530 [soil metagenome]|jgi:nitroimidazol reductase NimA-like FMN-containing flavoprotein (pyridoxamine 5'-phosphate oxidase superfamily)